MLYVIRDGIAEFDAAPTVASSNTRMTPEEKDARVRDIAVQNIRSMFLTSSAPGNRVKSSQEILHVISSVVMSKVIASERLGKAVERVFGISKKQRGRGINLNHSRSNCLTPGITLRRKPQSSGPKALLDLDFVYDWFHEECPLVEVDKRSETQRMCMYDMCPIPLLAESLGYTTQTLACQPLYVSRLRFQQV